MGGFLFVDLSIINSKQIDMKKLFLFIAMSVSVLSAIAQDFETPIHRKSMAYVEPHEWSTVDGEPSLIMMKGPSNELHQYVLDFLEWCGVEYGKKTYYVIASNGMALKVSISEGDYTTWIIVDIGKQ